MNRKTVLVTGGTGFIGYHTAKALLKRGDAVLLVDNINDYYDENLKYARLTELGIATRDSIEGNWIYSSLYPDLKFCRMDISDEKAVNMFFEQQEFDYIRHLAAQVGVRYSLVNQKALSPLQFRRFLLPDRRLPETFRKAFRICEQQQCLWVERRCTLFGGYIRRSSGKSLCRN